MKKLKVTSAILSVAMSVSMVIAPVTVMADETSVPEETQIEKPEKQETKETEKPSIKETEKQEPEESQKEEPAETDKQEASEEKEPETEETEVSQKPVAEAEDKKEALNAIASGKCGKNLKWSLSNDYVLTISGKGSMYGYSDKSLAPWIADYYQKITKIVVSNGVTAIGSYAFYWCENATSVSLPSTLKIIANHAFYKCDGLKEIKIPANVKTIDSQAFSECSQLETLTLPRIGLETIGEKAFEQCQSLTSFIVPLTVTSIGDNAFYNCKKLAYVWIGQYQDSLTNSNAFSYCSDKLNKVVHDYCTKGEIFDGMGLTSYKVLNPALDGTGTVALESFGATVETLVIPNAVTHYGSDSGESVKYKVTSIQTAENMVLSIPHILKKLVIGSNVVSIEDKAFSGCRCLESVTGGAGLKSIGTRAFEKCPKLKVFNITSKNLTKIGAFAFAADTSLKTVQIKKTTKLTKSGVKNSMKGSSVKTVKVKKSKVKKYKKIFKKKNCGKKVKVKK